MIIYIINCLLLVLAGVAWRTSDNLNLVIRGVMYLAAMYNGFEAYRFYIMGS